MAVGKGIDTPMQTNGGLDLRRPAPDQRPLDEVAIEAAEQLWRGVATQMKMSQVVHCLSLALPAGQSKWLMETIGTNDLYIAQRRYKVRHMTIRNDNAMDIDLDAIIKALAHPVRRDILDWLKAPERNFAEQDHPLEIGVCAGKIFLRTGLSQSTVSAHLTTLQRAGLVTSRKVGQWHFFKRNDELIQAFVERLGQQI